MTSGQIVMFDAIDIAQIPAGPQAVAGYVDGRWPTAQALAARFPHAKLLTIAVSAAGDAEALDIEAGDATPPEAAAWHQRQQARGVARPCLYASVDLMQSAVLPVMKAAEIDRGAVRIWTAHYAGKHICGPSSCGELAIDASASSQFVSGLLMAGPRMERGLEIELSSPLVSVPYVEMTRAVSESRSSSTARLRACTAGRLAAAACYPRRTRGSRQRHR